MDHFSAMARGLAARGKPQIVFDWDRAAELIRERQPITASASLAQDWEYTGGTIYENGEPIRDSYTYLSSNWATPELDMDGDVVPCWKYKSETKWDSDTKWPETALAILGVAVPDA